MTTHVKPLSSPTYLQPPPTPSDRDKDRSKKVAEKALRGFTIILKQV